MDELRQSTRASLAAEVLRRTGRLAMRVYGTSMLGAIWPGDEVVFEICEPDDVALGDVLLYRRDDRLVVHRVIQIFRLGEALEFQTRGDNQRGCDLPVSAEELLGRAVLLRHANGSPARLAQKRSPAAKLFACLTSRSTLVCELVLRLHAAFEWLFCIFSSEPRHGNGSLEAQS
jgi:signal peptidase I